MTVLELIKKLELIEISEPGLTVFLEDWQERCIAPWEFTHVCTTTLRATCNPDIGRTRAVVFGCEEMAECGYYVKDK